MADKKGLDEDEKSTLRKVFTVVTSPIWVPVAAVGGLAAAPVKAVSESIDEGKEKDSAAKGVGSLPGNLLGNMVTGPIDAIKKVGETMWKD